MNHFAEHPQSEWVCGDAIMFGEGHETRVIRSKCRSRRALFVVGLSRAAARSLLETELVRSRISGALGLRLRSRHVRAAVAGRHKCEYMPLPMAAYRLHEVSKTIRRGSSQLEEFDRIAEFYEPQLQGVDQRWCSATRFLRLSYAASEAGRKTKRSSWLMRAFATHPKVC
jgi:hypothetical protein